MIVRVRAFANFREVIGRNVDVDLNGDMVEELLDILCASHHPLYGMIFDESGGLKGYVNILRNRKRINSLNEKLEESDEIVIFPVTCSGEYCTIPYEQAKEWRYKRSSCWDRCRS
jgi:MoaD family protein